MQETVIVSAVRTPFGSFGGSLKSLQATELGGIVIREAIARAGIDGADVDLAIMGQVLQAGCGQIPSRQATVKGGLPIEVPSETINKVCASSFRAVTMADQIIRAGDAEIVVAGGMESMTNAPFASHSHRWGQRMFNSAMTDLMVHDGLWCAFYDKHMAVHGGGVAKEYDISREDQDAWALCSQLRAAAAINKGLLKAEIVPVAIREKKRSYIFDTDESPRPDTTFENLAKLPPLFDPDNTVTAGNAPGTNDGASALVLMEARRAAEMGIKPLAKIIGHTMVSADPAYIATVPGLAANKLLRRLGLTIGDIDLIEANEAFAAVTLVSGKITGWDPKRVNVNGGAIAFGHPIGATGGRIITTLAHELARRGGKYGLAAICSGAAQGDALIIERI